MPDLKELRDKAGQLNSEARQVIAKADEEKRELTPDESARVDKIYDDYDKVKESIQAQEKADARRSRANDDAEWLKQSAGRKSAVGLIAPQTPITERTQPISVEIGRDRRPGVPDGSMRTMQVAPGHPMWNRSTPEYARAMDSYILDGIKSDLLVGSNTKGGYLTTTAMSSEIIKFLDDMVFMRRIGRVLPPLGSAVSLGIPSWDSDPADADWTPEVPASDISADTSITLGKRELTPHLDAKLVKISRKLLASAVLDIGQYVSQRIAYKHGITEEKAFLSGDGAQQPLGVFTATSQGISTARDTTSSSTTGFTGDDLIDTLGALKEQYQNRSTWVVSRPVLTIIRKMKDGVGRPLYFEMGLQHGMPDKILGRPVVVSEHAPSTMTTGLYAAIVGDFSFYWIADSMGMEIERIDQLFTLRNQVGFLGRKETDGMPVLEEAFQRLILD